jgi:hypothetical protein
VGGSPARAARSVLPEWLERNAEIETGDPLEVRVSAPALLPGVPPIAVRAATRLGAEVADG